MKHAALCAVILFAIPCRAKDVVLVEDGKPQRRDLRRRPALWDDPAKNPGAGGRLAHAKPEDNRRRLRESVRDFAAILQRITGAKIDDRRRQARGRQAPAHPDRRIWPPSGSASRTGSIPFGQGFRIVVSDKGVGLAGESDLGTSYAIYTFLHHLGCRWYMPGTARARCCRRRRRSRVPEQDIVTGPYTIYRGMWYCDNDFARRNRMGGLELAAGHALEFTVPKELREDQPGDPGRSSAASRTTTWSSGRTRSSPTPSPTPAWQRSRRTPSINTFSLSPGRRRRAGTSPTTPSSTPATSTRRRRRVSKTDRLMVLANRVADAGDGEAPGRQVRHARLRRLHPAAGAREGAPERRAARSRRSPSAGPSR